MQKILDALGIALLILVAVFFILLANYAGLLH